MRRFMQVPVALLVVVFLTATAALPATAGTGDSSDEDRVLADVAGHWAETVIDKWVGQGWADGYPDGTFRPEVPVTRAEFMAFVNRAFEYESEDASGFIDVSEEAWYAHVVAAAAVAGYIQGDPDGRVRPGDEISRQEAAVALVRVLDLEGAPGGTARFVDAFLFPGWSAGAIGAAVEAGLVRGYPDATFRPFHSLTRAEAVTIIDNASDAWLEALALAEAEIEVESPEVLAEDEEETPPSPTRYQLTLESHPDIGGTVFGGGRFTAARTVTVEAEPLPGYVFSQWTENGVPVSQQPSFAYTMPASHVTLVAHFTEAVPDAYTLTVVADPVDGGTVTGGGDYPPGADVTVTAEAESGYLFKQWSIDGVPQSWDPSFAFMMPAESRTLVAEFIEDTGEVFTVTYRTGHSIDEGIGVYCFERDEVFAEITQQVPAGLGATPVLAMVDYENFAFMGWSDGTGSELRQDGAITEDVTLTPLFDPLYSLAVDAGEGGQVVGGERYYYPRLNGEYAARPIRGAARHVEGERVLLQATADPGFVFDGWMLGGDVLSDETDYEYDMPGEDITLFATFSEAPFELNFTVDPDTPHGIIEGPTHQEVQYGEDAVQVRAVPDANYLFDGWSDGRRHNPRQELHVTRNFDAQARFVPVPTIQLAPPDLSPASVGNYAGSDIGITPINQVGLNSWLSQVDEVRVNEVPLGPDQYTIEWDLFAPIRILLHTADIESMHTPGDYQVAVLATGYAPATVAQSVTAGEAAELSVAVQPGGPPNNGERLSPQPVVHVLDAYGNLCETGPGAETPVSVSKDEIGVGDWTLEGTVDLRAQAGVVAFEDLRTTNNDTGLIHAELVFTAEGLEDVRSDDFTLPFGDFDSAWLRSDLEDNYAGATLTLPYAANLGNFVNWVTVNDGDPLVWADQVAYNPANHQGNLTLFTREIPALQTRGNHIITLEFNTGIIATAVQPITAGPADSMEVLVQPVGPASDPSVDPAHWRRLTRDPVVGLFDAYGNPCYDGPSSGEMLTVEAAAGGDDANWALDGATGHFSGGTATLWLYTMNEIAHDVPNARVTFECAGIANPLAVSEPFTVPRGLHAPPELRIFDPELLAGQPIMVSVLGPAEHWRNSITSIMINGEEVPGAAVEYFPEFAKYYITPEDVPGLTERGSYTLAIESDYYDTATVDFDVLAGHAHEIQLVQEIVAPFLWGAPLRQQPIVHVVDQYGNLCADGPSSSGVTVSAHAIVEHCGLHELAGWLWSNSWQWTIGDNVTTHIEATGGVAEFTDLAPRQTNSTAHQRSRGADMEFRATGLETITTYVLLNRLTTGVSVDNPGEPLFHNPVQLRGPDEVNNIVGEEIRIEIARRYDPWDEQFKYPSVNGVILDDIRNNYELHTPDWYEGMPSVSFYTDEIGERHPGAGFTTAGEHEIILYSYDAGTYLDQRNVSHYLWRPRVIQQTMLPAEAESIEIVAGPGDLAESGDLLTLEAHLLDAWGNLCYDGPSGDWTVGVSEYRDGPVPLVDPRWTLSVTGTNIPGDGTFTFSVRATNDTSSPIYDARIAFFVGAGHMVVVSEPFTIPPR